MKQDLEEVATLNSLSLLSLFFFLSPHSLFFFSFVQTCATGQQVNNLKKVNEMTSFLRVF